MDDHSKSKHFINCLEKSVSESLVGFATSHPNLQAIDGIDVLVRKDYLDNVLRKNKVALLSGAGSGHEPMNAGYVGAGGLTAFVAGQIFASPTTHQVLKAIRLLGKELKSSKDVPTEEFHSKGVLIVIMNYTGDRLNFGLACERAKLEGINVDMFTFSDDVAFYGEGRNIGRRGLAGVVMFNKIMGALAESGIDLQSLKSEAEEINKRIGTMSVCLRSCNVPGTGMTFQLAPDEIEVGLGIHGEPGIHQSKLLTSRETVQLLIDHLISKRSPLRNVLDTDGSDEPVRIAIVLNNLGGLSNFEMNILLKDTLEQLKEKMFSVERIFTGTFCTSFSMPGVSLSLMKVNDRYLQLLDAPCDIPVWPADVVSLRVNRSPILHLEDLHIEHTVDYRTEDAFPFDRTKFLEAVKVACHEIIKSESYLNDLDKEAGDGDCGTTQRKGATAILESINNGTLVGSFVQMASLCDRQMGGTSGAILSFLFTGVAKVLSNVNGHSEVVKVWRDALRNGITTISRYSLAQPGDRTMLDTLDGVQKCLNDNLDQPLNIVAQKVIQAADESAARTATMSAKAGRASYVNQDRIRNRDPGATAVAIWIKAVATLFL